MKKFFTFSLFLNFVCYAEDELEQVLNHNTYQPNYFSLLFGLLFVIALIYITGILYKKLTKIKIGDAPEEKFNIELISSASLGQNKNLYIIKTDNKYSLIAETQNNITYLRDLGEENNDNNIEKI